MICVYPADCTDFSNNGITSANIDEANIDWAAITTLSAAVASMVKADIGTADIDWSHIKDLATDTAIITQGTAGELYIAKLAVTEANMVSLTVSACGWQSIRCVETHPVSDKYADSRL